MDQKGRNPLQFEVVEDSRGYGRRYLVKITVPKDLSGLLLRNRSRIESNLLTAIRKLISFEKPHWDASAISKITVEIK